MKTEAAKKHFGGTVRLAEALGIRHPAVCKWGEFVPELRAYQLERITNGKLKAGDYSQINKTNEG